ncbi:hypothetical protein [Mesorhizobium sp. B2-1-3A]|uniref:hypothetical protein n=1 Tax=Mesorhizobium sp. B2-1-3A TaxID=2589971 RepID=UPI001FEFE0E9|nr:hypothetical protein [Mesorhizobium sp. B2-1-3A]
MSDGSVLIVEDETMILLDLEPALEEAGFQVVGTRNAAEALAAFDSDPTKFKAVLTDIRLGPGQSGRLLGICEGPTRPSRSSTSAAIVRYTGVPKVCPTA